MNMNIYRVVRKAQHIVDMYNSDALNIDIDALTDAEKSLPYDVLKAHLSDDVANKASYLVTMYEGDSTEDDVDAIMEAEKSLPYDILSSVAVMCSSPDVAVSDINHDEYIESRALQNLLLAIRDAENEEFVRTCHDQESGQFTINIAGKSIAFFTGGPQCEALYAFIEHICGENLYSVNLANGTVRGYTE